MHSTPPRSMKGSAFSFLPGVPANLVHEALARAGGDEIGSGKLGSPESSAALAVNTFAWFSYRARDLPPFPPLADLDWPATRVDIERQMRFPWRGGRHPWLDAAVETSAHLSGVESKRYEPFRDTKTVRLSDAYDRDVWGELMTQFVRMRDTLRAGTLPFMHLDATQLVRHAFGLVTEARRVGKAPVLFYLYAEPKQRGSTTISTDRLACHRAEIRAFAEAVAGAEVRFEACSYREWISTWTADVQQHGEALLGRFQP